MAKAQKAPQTIEAAYEEERARSEKEHHLPSAGAMIGHVNSNLVIHLLKIEQARLFAGGPTSFFLEEVASQWQKAEAAFLIKINDSLFSEGDLIPTTTDEFLQFSMVEQSAAGKYAQGQDQLFGLIKDFDTQLLFVERAEKLARKEGHFGQVRLMEELDSWLKEQIDRGQKFLGHEVREGLYQEEDDEEDDED